MQPNENQPEYPQDPRFADADTDPRYYDETQPASLRPVTPMRYANSDASYAPSWRGWRASQIIYTIGGIVEALILIRAILELLAANPSAAFTSFIYTITDPLVAPFQGVFPSPQSHGNVLDLAAVLAIIVYALLTWVVARLFELIRRRSVTVD